MRKPDRALIFLLAFALSFTPAAALEAKEGLVKLVISEANARISVYRLIDVAKGRYEALIFDQDPRTSFATLSVDGKQYKLGDASDYRFIVTRTDTGARIEFKSSSCIVREDLDFAKSRGAALVDGIRMKFTIENVSQKDADIGLRLLIDTWLAEKSGLHFRTDQRERIQNETSIGTTDADSWIATQGERADFMILLGGKDAGRPDRALLANWKRLNDEAWSLAVNPARNFTLLPYSVNDSAVALYWEPILVSRGASRSISTVIGTFNENGYPNADIAVDQSTDDIFAQTVLNSGGSSDENALAADLVAVRDLISRIDRAITSGIPPTQEEIDAWQKILDRLEERKKGF